MGAFAKRDMDVRSEGAPARTICCTHWGER